MKGSNTIKMNQDTMKEAVQMYLDSQFMPGKAPRVENVAFKNETYNGEWFVIETNAEGERDDKKMPGVEL